MVQRYVFIHHFDFRRKTWEKQLSLPLKDSQPAKLDLLCSSRYQGIDMHF